MKEGCFDREEIDAAGRFFQKSQSGITSFSGNVIIILMNSMKYKPGQIVEGRVTGIQSYGAFVALDGRTTGLIHISEISDGFVRDIEQYVHVGQTIRVKVIDYDPEADQARLSLKALHHTRVRNRRRQPLTKASLPPSEKGFSSIRENMPRWIEEAREQMKEKGR
jgi:predicted RNA-binding protein with RPS1 domain